METNGNGNTGGGILSGYMVNGDPGYTQTFGQGGMGAPTTPPKKKGPVLAIILSVVGVLLVGGGILAFVFRGVLANSWARMTMSPDEYCRHVLTKNLSGDKDFWKDYGELYSQAASMKGILMSGETRLELSNDMIRELEDLYTEFERSNSYYVDYSHYDEYMDYIDRQGSSDLMDYDAWLQANYPIDDDEPAINLSALKDIALVYEFERNEETARSMQALQLADREYLFTLNEIYDSEKERLYLQMPEINTDYAAIEMDEFLDEDELEMVSDFLFGSRSMSSQLIEPKVAQALADRYLNVMISGISGVDEKNDTLKIAGESQKCVALRFTIDEDMIVDTVQELCETMMDDDDLEQIVKDYVSNNLPTEDPKAIWKQVTDTLEQTIEDIEDADITAEAECTIYVSNTGEIIGVRIGDDDDNEFLLGYVVSKGKLYVEMSVVADGDELLTLEGLGKLTAAGAAADFTLFVEELDEEFHFAVEDVNDKGGVFTMELGQFFDLARKEGLSEEIDDEIGGIAKLVEDGTLRIERRADGKNSSFSVAVMDGSKKVVSVSSKMSVSDAGTIELPGSRETEKISDEMDILSYLMDCDLGELVDRLEELGLPEEDAEEFREELEWMMY